MCGFGNSVNDHQRILLSIVLSSSIILLFVLGLLTRNCGGFGNSVNDHQRNLFSTVLASSIMSNYATMTNDLTFVINRSNLKDFLTKEQGMAVTMDQVDIYLQVIQLFDIKLNQSFLHFSCGCWWNYEKMKSVMELELYFLPMVENI